jgi:hypothetical protein
MIDTSEVLPVEKSTTRYRLTTCRVDIEKRPKLSDVKTTRCSREEFYGLWQLKNDILDTYRQLEFD